MKTVEVQPNQNIYDLAAQHYGSLAAVDELLSLNPDLENDPVALVACGAILTARQTFRLDVAVKEGFPLRIDTASRLMNRQILHDIKTDITTYQPWQEQ